MHAPNPLPPGWKSWDSNLLPPEPRLPQTPMSLQTYDVAVADANPAAAAASPASPLDHGGTLLTAPSTMSPPSSQDGPPLQKPLRCRRSGHKKQPSADARSSSYVKVTPMKTCSYRLYFRTARSLHPRCHRSYRLNRQSTRHHHLPRRCRSQRQCRRSYRLNRQSDRQHHHCHRRRHRPRRPSLTPRLNRQSICRHRHHHHRTVVSDFTGTAGHSSWTSGFGERTPAGPPPPPPWSDAFSTDPDRILCRNCLKRSYVFPWCVHCYMCHLNKPKS